MRLKHAVRFQAGGTPDTGNPAFWSEDVEGVPWVAIGDMSSNPTVTSTTKRLTELGLADRGLLPSGPGTVLFAMYASVGAVSTLALDAVGTKRFLGSLRATEQMTDL